MLHPWQLSKKTRNFAASLSVVALGQFVCYNFHDCYPNIKAVVASNIYTRIRGIIEAIDFFTIIVISLEVYVLSYVITTTKA